MAIETNPTHTCDVCGCAKGEVHDSGLGPTAYSICKVCLEKGAESIGVVCLWIFLQGGTNKVEQNYPDIGSENGLKSYADGQYIGCSEICAIYPEYKSLFERKKNGSHSLDQ